MTSPAKVLRQRLERGDFIVGMGAWDVLSAKIIERTGFDMVALQSGQYAAGWGVADVQLRTASDLVEICFKTCGEIDIPLLLDVEDGFGGAAQAAYWLQEFERAGVAMVHIDDLGGSYKCPFLPGVDFTVETAESTAAKIAAMVDARRADIIICARATAALAVRDDSQQSLEETFHEQIRRLKLYRDAGAEVLWLPSVAERSRELMSSVPAELGVPLITQSCPLGFFPVSMTGTYLPDASFKELQSAGIQLFSFPVIQAVAYRALWDALAEIRREGSIRGVGDRMLSEATWLELSGYNKLRRIMEKAGETASVPVR